MKISKKQLRQIIDEEIQKVVLLETLKINNKRGLTQAMILENLREDIKLLSELEITSAPRKVVSIITKALLDGLKLSVSGNLRLGSLISNVIAFINKHFSSVTEATGKKLSSIRKGLLMIASVVLANTMMAAFANVARADIKVGRSTFKAHDEKGQALKGIISTLKDLSIQKGDQDVANECDRLIELINHSKTFRIDTESKELIVNIFLRSVASLDIIKQFLESDPLWSEVLDDLITAGKQSSRRVEQDFGQIKFEDLKFVQPAGTHNDYAGGGSTTSAKGAGRTFVGSAMYPAGQKDLRAPRNQNGKISYDYVRDINKGLARR